MPPDATTAERSVGDRVAAYAEAVQAPVLLLPVSARLYVSRPPFGVTSLESSSCLSMVVLPVFARAVEILGGRRP